MIKKVNGGVLSRNNIGLLIPSVSEFLADGDTTIEDFPTGEDIAVGSQVLKLNDEGDTEVFIFGPSRKWYRYNGVSFLG